jgi:hypothetical protein
MLEAATSPILGDETMKELYEDWRVPGGDAPCLRAIWWFFYRLLNRNRLKVRGQSNLVLVDPQVARVKKVLFDIEGDWNTVFIDRGARLENVIIQIKGSFDKLVIGQGCVLDGVRLSFEEDGGQIRMGSGTRMRGVYIIAAEPGATITTGQDCIV